MDAEFNPADGPIPKIYDALEINFEVGGEPVKLTLEVQQHLGELVRAIAMSGTEGPEARHGSHQHRRSDFCSRG